MNPQFPIYIVSKGRWESRLTVKAFEKFGIPYSIIIEKDEYKNYSEVINKKNILILDPLYQQKYDIFSDIGVPGRTGSGPARNFAWEHSISCGALWHWCIDDNIKTFYRYNKNLKIQVSDGTIFRCMEDFVLRYKNIGMAGPNYGQFIPRKWKWPPIRLNTRIYSCNLIRNDTGFRWRGKYNEDTDLSLRLLKAKWCTVLFNAFLQDKMVTMALKGGNTDSIYTCGTLPKSQMLVDMHPDVAQIIKRYDRWHHYVDYRPFKDNKLILRDDIKIFKGINNYGMELIESPIQ